MSALTEIGTDPYMKFYVPWTIRAIDLGQDGRAVKREEGLRGLNIAW